MTLGHGMGCRLLLAWGSVVLVGGCGARSSSVGQTGAEPEFVPTEARRSTPGKEMSEPESIPDTEESFPPDQSAQTTPDEDLASELDEVLGSDDEAPNALDVARGQPGSATPQEEPTPDTEATPPSAPATEPVDELPTIPADDPDVGAAEPPVATPSADPPTPERVEEVEPDAPDGLVISDPTGTEGAFTSWCESGVEIGFDGERFASVEYPAPDGLLVMWWSIANDESGYYYSTGDSRVALAPAAKNVTDIVDATELEYVESATERIFLGQFVVYHHADLEVFVALRLDAIRDVSTPECDLAVGDFSFYVDDDGDFSN